MRTTTAIRNEVSHVSIGIYRPNFDNEPCCRVWREPWNRRHVLNELSKSWPGHHDPVDFNRDRSLVRCFQIQLHEVLSYQCLHTWRKHHVEERLELASILQQKSFDCLELAIVTQTRRIEIAHVAFVRRQLVQEFPRPLRIEIKFLRSKPTAIHRFLDTVLERRHVTFESKRGSEQSPDVLDRNDHRFPTGEHSCSGVYCELSCVDAIALRPDGYPGSIRRRDD